MLLALEKYTWLHSFAYKLCEQKNVDMEDVFKHEIEICKDMITLLPSKIDRIHYLGETSVMI